MAKGKKRNPPEVSSGSMADIAFLLLIFFLVTTTIANDRGIAMLLPPPPDPLQPEIDIKIPERNIFKILANSQDKLLVENEPFTESMDELTVRVKAFILNFGDPSPEGVELYNSLPPQMKVNDLDNLHPLWKIKHLWKHFSLVIIGAFGEMKNDSLSRLGNSHYV